MLISLSKFFAGILLLFANFFSAMVQVELKRHFPDLSSSSEGSLGRLEESDTSSRFTMG